MGRSDPTGQSDPIAMGQGDLLTLSLLSFSLGKIIYCMCVCIHIYTYIVYIYIYIIYSIYIYIHGNHSLLYVYSRSIIFL